MTGQHRPDLVVSNLSPDGKDTLLDFTSASPYAVRHLNHTSTTVGYAAGKKAEEKRAFYAGKFDEQVYNFIPLAMELGGCPSTELMTFIKNVAKKAAENNQPDENAPRIYRAQFAHKWRCRIVLAFHKFQAARALKLRQSILRHKVPKNLIPSVNDELFV